ncbi:helix-turn-helix domain-containing protein [Pseudomonas laurentiana]
MTTLARNKVLPAATPATDIRPALTKHRTATADGFVIDKSTGEVLGSYICSDYTPEQIDYPVTSAQENTTCVIVEDGSPVAIHSPVVNSALAAPVLDFPEATPLPRLEVTTGKGRKAQVIENGLCGLMWAAKVEGIKLPWLDHYVHGAINTGPGRINDRYSVSPADVTRLLYLPELSVETASRCLLNHDHKPMSVRQIQRVVEAARIALRGIALYFERHPKIVAQLDLEIDFNLFWQTGVSEVKQTARLEHPKRQEVLRLLDQGEAIKAIARQTGVSKTTVKKWQVEAQAA